MKTVKEVAALTGISVRTLQYYDEIGVFKPTSLTEAGYRLYDEEALKTLQQILFFKELDFPLKDIKAIMEDPHYDKLKAFKKQKELLKVKRDRLTKLLSLLEKLEKEGLEPGLLHVASGMSDESPVGNATGDTSALPEATMPSSIQVYGTVTEINGNQVMLENDNQNDPYSRIVLNINEDTLILTATDCIPKKLKDLKVGETLYAYVSPMMTRSLPPISNAELVICQVPEDMAAPTYATITEITSMNDGTPAYVTDRDIIYFIGENTVIKTLDGKKELTAADLTPGTKVLAWYQIMTMSIPAQTTPDEIRVLP